MAPKRVLSRQASGGGSLSSAGFTSYADRLPKAKATGNFLEDSQNEANHVYLKEIISRCQRDGSHICALHSTLMKRVRALKEQNSDPNECFDPAPNFLIKVDDAWVVNWVVEHSDLNLHEVVAIKKFDSEAPLHLFSYATQLLPTTRLAATCRMKAVLGRVAVSRHDVCGQRLFKFKGRGGLGADGRLNWHKVGSYGLVFAGERCTHVVHNATNDRVLVPSHVLIHKDFALLSNWSDQLAEVQKPPLPPFRLSSLWAVQERKGPFFHCAVRSRKEQGPRRPRRLVLRGLGGRSGEGAGACCEQGDGDGTQGDDAGGRQGELEEGARGSEAGDERQEAAAFLEGQRGVIELRSARPDSSCDNPML